MIDTGHKLSFNLLSHYKENETIRSICSSLRSVFSWSDPSEKFGTTDDPSLLLSFVKDVLHKDSCEYLFKIMYDSVATKEVRASIGRTVARVLSKAIKLVIICREDPERRELPIVMELSTLATEIMKILFGNLKNRRL